MATPSCTDNRIVCIYQFLQEIAQESASFRKKARENQSIIKGYSQSKLVNEGQIRELASENAELKNNIAVEMETNATKVGSLQSENMSLTETIERLTKNNHDLQARIDALESTVMALCPPVSTEELISDVSVAPASGDKHHHPSNSPSNHSNGISSEDSSDEHEDDNGSCDRRMHIGTSKQAPDSPEMFFAGSSLVPEEPPAVELSRTRNAYLLRPRR